MPSGTHNGWHWDTTNNRLDFYYRGTKNGYFTGTAFSPAGLQSTTTITATTGWVDTTGNTVNSAGDLNITAGNLRLGAVEAFANTQPTSAVVMKAGTASVGTIATSGGFFSSSTVVRKVIAAGTVSNIET